MASSVRPNGKLHYDAKMMSDFKRWLQDVSVDEVDGKQKQNVTQKHAKPVVTPVRVLTKINDSFSKDMMDEFGEWAKETPPVVYVADAEVQQLNSLIWVKAHINILDRNSEIMGSCDIVGMWDTGAMCSIITTELLPAHVVEALDVFGGDRIAFAYIQFTGTNNRLPVAFLVRDQAKMPGHLPIVIFGQKYLMQNIDFQLRGNEFHGNPNRMILSNYRLGAEEKDFVQLIIN